MSQRWPTETALGDIALWSRPTIEQVRNLVLENWWISGPPDSDDPLAGMASTEPFLYAVSAGRLFDLGHLPNALIKKEAERAGKLFGSGHIGHPFREAYAIFHTWEDGGSLYVVDPIDWHAFTKGAVPPGTFIVREALAAMFRGRRVLMLGDCAHAAVDSVGRNYIGRVGRSSLVTAFRLLEPERGAMCSVVDPVVATMLLLATDGIAVERIRAPEKLNKVRVRTGKLPIPAHWQVRTAEYVTALGGHKHRGEPQGGHYARPIPHLRRGHVRHLPTGKTTWVRDALVNLRDPNAPLGRAFYRLDLACRAA